MKNKILFSLSLVALFASNAFAVTTITGSVTLSNAASSVAYSASRGVTISTMSTVTNYAVTTAHANGMNKAKGTQYGTTDASAAVMQACPGTTAATHPQPITAATALPTVSTCASGIPTTLTSTFK